MFKSARLKLTAWYLLIIMSVSLFFSVLIHRGLTMEVDRISRMERVKIQTGPFEYQVFRPAFLDPEVIETVKHRITVSLLVINGIILVTSGGLGYFLAGKTLRPIAEMVEEQNRFVSDASHELRTPLTSLKTAIEVGLRDKKLDLAGSKKLIRENLAEINKLQTLSEGLLQLTQYRSGSNNFKLESVSFKKIVDEVIVKMERIAISKKVKIKNNIKDYRIMGNPYSLSDLLVILIDNAIKYSRTGGEVIVESGKAKKWASISVADNGIGIADEDIPHIFDRFYRAETARSRKGSGGYGLGLSIAKKIVEAHHGTIEVKSKVNRGTTVTVSFPLV